MNVAVIPIKRLEDAKSRLSRALPDAARLALVRWMLAHTVRALRESQVVDTIALAAAQPDLARELEVTLIPDAGDLNATLRGAIGWARQINASRLLILPADLPQLAADDLAALFGDAADIVIAPTHDGGTGALLLTPPDAIMPSFGPESFQRHLDLARAASRSVHVVRRPAFLYDVDRPEDVARLEALAGGGPADGSPTHGRSARG